MALPPHLQTLMNQTGHIGWIPPHLRTQAQHTAHLNSIARHVAFGLAPPKATGPVKVVLTDLWSDPLVVADLGFAFTGYYQFTGSCVGVSTGNAVNTLSFVQRKLATNPTKALLSFWPFDYGQCRKNEGDSGEGEGAVDSVMGQTISGNGVLTADQQGLPTFNQTPDGFQLSQSLEMTWSNGAASVAQPYLTVAKQYPVGGIATLNNVADIKAAILNGYPVLDGCDNYVGSGSVQGSGADSAVVGQYDGAGGHCLSGDTKIPLLDGTESTIKELADAGKPSWIYSYDDATGRVIPKKAKARMTRKKVPEGMVRVTLDNDESVTTTLDHRFMLRDGSYKQAQHLKSGDSLMPLYRKVSTKKDSKRHPGYEMVSDPVDGKWELTHRRVAEHSDLETLRFIDGTLSVGTLPAKVRGVIHHDDFNKRNNTPSNLKWMVCREHWRYHAAVADGVWERMDEDYRKGRKAKMRRWIKKLWKDPEYRAMMQKVSVASAKKMWNIILSDPKLYSSHVKRSSESMKNLWADPKWRAKMIVVLKENMASPEAKAKVAAACRKKNVDPEFRKKVSAGQTRSWADPVVKASRMKVITAARQTPAYRAMMAEAQRKRWARQKQEAAPTNHKVASVTFLPNETGPTYCFQVEGTHNFAVSAGVFVHNSTCILGYWDNATLGPLYLYSNQWATSTYPSDPGGGGRCCVWIKEATMAKLFQTGGSGGETMALSHLTYFPSQPEVLTWSDAA